MRIGRGRVLQQDVLTAQRLVFLQVGAGHDEFARIEHDGRAVVAREPGQGLGFGRAQQQVVMGHVHAVGGGAQAGGVALSAPSGLARGTTSTLMRASSGSSSPPGASSRAMISKASLPAGSSPCCWPTSNTVGRLTASRAWGVMLLARVATSACMGSPRCEVPAVTRPSSVPLPSDRLATWRSHCASSACVVKLLRPASSPGVA
ncbi:hypothetical protein D3C78_1383210 [compost metagenome]